MDKIWIQDTCFNDNDCYSFICWIGVLKIRWFVISNLAIPHIETTKNWSNQWCMGHDWSYSRVGHWRSHRKRNSSSGKSFTQCFLGRWTFQFVDYTFLCSVLLQLAGYWAAITGFFFRWTRFETVGINPIDRSYWNYMILQPLPPSILFCSKWHDDSFRSLNVVITHFLKFIVIGGILPYIFSILRLAQSIKERFHH